MMCLLSWIHMERILLYLKLDFLNHMERFWINCFKLILQEVSRLYRREYVHSPTKCVCLTRQAVILLNSQKP